MKRNVTAIKRAPLPDCLPPGACLLAQVWAAIMARPVLGERIARRTIVCVIFAISGGLVLCYGNGLRIDGTGSLDTRAAIGIAFAFGTGLGNACMFTAVSSAVLRAPETEIMLGTTLGFVIQSIAGILLEPVLGGPTFELPLWELSSAALGFIALSGVLVALGIAMSLVACEVVTPAEVCAGTHSTAQKAHAALCTLLCARLPERVCCTTS